MSAAQRTNLVNMVNDDLIAAGNTPLCETLSEVYRYLSGASVNYGDNKRLADRPARDLQAESNLQVDHLSEAIQYRNLDRKDQYKY